MADWIIREPEAPNDPYWIETDGTFAGVYNGMGPGQKMYTLVDAVKWVSYRMDIGDRILTRKAT